MITLQIENLRDKNVEVIEMYYVYIHKDKITKEIVYAGKGKGLRYADFVNSRNEEHSNLMKNRKLEYLILKEFEDEDEAYKYEEEVIESYKKNNQCKYNVSIGRRTSDETKTKISRALRGKKRTEESRQKIADNHARPNSIGVSMYKGNQMIKTFSSLNDAARFASQNGICSYGWVGRSLKTGEPTKSTKFFPIGGFHFVYEDDRM